MYASDYRRVARDTLRGKWRTVLSVMLLAQLVSMSAVMLAQQLLMYMGMDQIYSILSTTPEAANYEGLMDYLSSYLSARPSGMIWLLLAVMVIFGCVSMIVTIGEYRVMTTLRQGETPRVRQLFPWRLFGKALLMNIVRALILSFALLLFLIPGMLIIVRFNLPPLLMIPLIIPGIVTHFRYFMADYLLAEKPELGSVRVLRESREYMKGHKGELFCLQFSFFGWSFLAMFVSALIDQLLYGMGLGSVLYMLLATVVELLIDTPLNSYMLMAQTVFFDRLAGEPHAQRASEFNNAYGNTYGNTYGAQEQRAYTDASTAYQQSTADASEAENERKSADLGADESAAKELFINNGCSRNRLREAGLMEDYEALRPSSISEANWRRDYCDELVRRFDRDPSALAELLGLSAEYADEQLITRVLARIERHIRQQTLPDSEILDMVGSTIAMLTSGAFPDAAFLDRRREQILDMTERLAERLNQTEPDGNWQSTARMVRQLCGKDPD